MSFALPPGRPRVLNERVACCIGLFFINPLGLIAAQLIGNALALGLGRRQPPKKLAFNLSLLTLQAALAVAVFRAIVTDLDPLAAGGSFGTLLAVGVGVVAANVLINSAILLSGGGLTGKKSIRSAKRLAV